jgi:hypothetical protein
MTLRAVGRTLSSGDDCREAESGSDATPGSRLVGKEISMDDLKRAYRDVKTEMKKTARSIDGTDPKDRLENAGDEIDKDLGNLGDDIRKAGREPGAPGEGPAAAPERTI